MEVSVRDIKGFSLMLSKSPNKEITLMFKDDVCTLRHMDESGAFANHLEIEQEGEGIYSFYVNDLNKLLKKGVGIKELLLKHNDNKLDVFVVKDKTKSKVRLSLFEKNSASGVSDRFFELYDQKLLIPLNILLMELKNLTDAVWFEWTDNKLILTDGKVETELEVEHYADHPVKSKFNIKFLLDCLNLCEDGDVILSWETDKPIKIQSYGKYVSKSVIANMVDI